MKMPSHPFCDVLLLDEDDDEEEDDMFFLLLCLAASSEETVPRASYHVRDRIEWDAHVAELSLEDNAFSSLYRMELVSFNKLCSLLKLCL